MAHAAHGVELPPDFPASSSAAEVALLLEMYFGTQHVHVVARKLMARAALLRTDWQRAELACMERYPREHRQGTPERLAAEASRRAMVKLIEAARELAALPVRH